MIHIPVLRWGEPYQSLESDKVVHFATGELVERDMRHAQRARDVLREIPIKDLLKMAKKAGELYASAELPLGDGSQTPADFNALCEGTPQFNSIWGDGIVDALAAVSVADHQ